VPLDKLAPILIRRYRDEGYRLIVIDPIYKVITGDENAASDMAAFCNLFDAIATECGCAMVYSHHYSKGANAKYRNASERASGSGVFTRDPDAILSMSELSVDEAKLATYRTAKGRPDTANPTGWRISSTLREFPTPPDFDIWFDWPLHVIDDGGILKSTKEADAPGDTGVGKGQMTKKDKVEAVRDQFEMLLFGTNDNAVRRGDIMEALDISETSLKNAVQSIEDMMLATLTVDGSPVPVVTDNGTEQIMFEGSVYIPQKTKAGAVRKNRPWVLW
jgi:hypothetical protein